MWPSQGTNDYTTNERSAPINMPNRQSDLTSGYADPHGVVFSPKSTDPANLGINMCINILEGDNSPRVKDSAIKDVTQHMQNMKIYTDSDNNKKAVDNSTVYDVKSDDKTSETESNRKQTPRSSPGHVNNDLTNSTNNENLPSTNPIGAGDDTNDGLITPSHLIMNGAPTASVPIPFQRMQANSQQQMLLYPQQQAYPPQYHIVSQQQQQAAHYDMNQPTTNFQTFDYTLIQPQSFESQSIMTAFNPQANGTNQQDPQLANLAQTPLMSWLSNTMAAQQQTANQQSPYASSNQYIINSNQDNYLQQLQNYHQSPATLPSLLGQPQYWSALPTALVFPAPPPQAMLAQQQTTTNEQQSPQSKANNNNRPLTPTNSGDILSTSQSNQQAQQYMNMQRTTQTPVNFPFFAAASPTFLDPSIMMPSTRQPTGSPGLRMYPQQVPMPVNTNNQGGLYGSPVASSLSSSFNDVYTVPTQRRDAQLPDFSRLVTDPRLTKPIQQQQQQQTPLYHGQLPGGLPPSPAYNNLMPSMTPPPSSNTNTFDGMFNARFFPPQNQPGQTTVPPQQAMLNGNDVYTGRRSVGGLSGPMPNYYAPNVFGGSGNNNNNIRGNNTISNSGRDSVITRSKLLDDFRNSRMPNLQLRDVIGHFAEFS
ncbi:unnamed protein product, partial [Rotaria sp. Silwood2]